jgi:CheY-like chemotaxis protein
MIDREQRKHPRVRIDKEVLINRSGAGRASSISEGGMFVLTGQEYQPEGQVVLTMALDGGVLLVPGVIRYCEMDVGMGVMFLNPTEEQISLIRQIGEAARAAQRNQGDTGLLIVDSNAIKRRAYARTLTRSGYKVHEAGSDLEAIELLRTKRVRAVIFDPFIQNGFSLLRRMRMQPESRAILPIVLASKPVSDDKKRMHLHAVPEILLKMTTPPLRLQQIVGRHLPL